MLKGKEGKKKNFTVQLVQEEKNGNKADEIGGSINKIRLSCFDVEEVVKTPILRLRHHHVSGWSQASVGLLKENESRSKLYEEGLITYHEPTL